MEKDITSMAYFAKLGGGGTPHVVQTAHAGGGWGLGKQYLHVHIFICTYV